MIIVFHYYEIWYYRKKFWWHKLSSNISFSFLMYWTYTLLLLLRSWIVDHISDCINEGNLHAAADDTRIPALTTWQLGHLPWTVYKSKYIRSRILCNKWNLKFTTNNTKVMLNWKTENDGRCMVKEWRQWKNLFIYG
jgi:hypothetical protein